MVHGLSQRSRAQWAAFAQSVGSDGYGPPDQELLNRFLIGVHQRGEELLAHDLKELVDDLEVSPELALEVVSLVESGFALLEAYDRSSAGNGSDDEEDEDQPEAAFVGDDDVAPGILVI